MGADPLAASGGGPSFGLRGASPVATGGIGEPEEGGSLWAWRSSAWSGSHRLLEASFYLRDAREVARGLLGTCFRSSAGGEEVRGVVVEAEAYLGPEDPASHASARVGATRRNRSMFGPPGIAYVFRSYGVHWCLNVVTGPVGFPAAVLIRALDPLSGMAVMARRRKGRRPLCAGPGRVGEALGVTEALDGHSLRRPPLELLEGWKVPESAVAVSGRVGIRHAADWPLRFFLRGHPEVSSGPRELETDLRKDADHP